MEGEKDDTYVRRNVNIRTDQLEKIKEKHLNFSSWVREMIDENLMED